MAEKPPDAPKDRRRPRYAGTHPRRFDQKYKELAPDRYPELTSRLRARGKTPAGQHVPILSDEVTRVLAPKPGGRLVDATLGWGGHAERLAREVLPTGHLLGLDADPIETPKTEAKFIALGLGDAVTVRRTNFAGLAAAVAGMGWHDGVDGVLVDLGVSSMQLDNPDRGFSFKLEGPLDMRMNPNRGLPASEWLRRASEADIVEALRENADEPRAARVGAAIFARRHLLDTTRHLSEVVRQTLAGLGPPEAIELSVRRVFQAVRIEVNDEFGALDALLRQLPEVLRAGGRVAMLTFHSGEDRRVKRHLADGAREGVYAPIDKDVIRASAAERRLNPRASAAKLRWAERR